MFSQGQGPSYSREGLSTRQQQSFSVRVEKPFDIDLEIEGLSSQVGRLKTLSKAIGEEGRQNRALAESLDGTLEEIKVRLKRGMRRMNRAYVQSKSNHWTHLILFIVGAFLLVYWWPRVARVFRWFV